jgi:hypothetical protein
MGLTPMEDHLRRPDPRKPAVEAVVLLHLGSLPGYLSWSNEFSSLEEFWARHLVYADVNALRVFGVFGDIEAIQEIARMARSLRGALERLSPSAQRGIELAKGTSPGPHGYKPVLGSTKADLEWLTENVNRYLEDTKSLTRASRKRNWRAASVARDARKVWAAAHWPLGPRPDIGSELSERYNRHLEEYAPRSAALGAPGPFGRFLEDVNAALEICTTSGDPISARTALDSLKALQAGPSRKAQEKSRSS